MKNFFKKNLPFFILPFSFFSFLGMYLGYCLANFYVEKLTRKSFFPQSIFLPLGKGYYLKFHHWLYSLCGMAFILIFDLPYFSHPFSLGLLGGIAWHDFVTDKHWYRLIFKKK